MKKTGMQTSTQFILENGKVVSFKEIERVLNSIGVVYNKEAQSLSNKWSHEQSVLIEILKKKIQDMQSAVAMFEERKR